ncbi:cell division protein [Bifidobacterium vespertilionis]|uniref:cell division protein n=1 Tax=Bifidobacterium vespertilionis TaxID=2562524 RepID=UPI0037C1218A
MMPQSAPRKAAEHVEDPQPAGAPPSFAVPAAFPAQTLPGEAPSDDRVPQDQEPAAQNDRTAQKDWAADDRAAQDDGNARPAPAQDASERRPRHAVMPEMPDLRVRSGDDLDSAADQSRNEFTTVYDILDAIEATLNEGKPGLFTPNLVKVDRDQLSGQIEDLKKKLPVQLERASALMREAERRLAGAQTQASAIVASAQSRAADMIKEANEQAQFLAGQENVVALAQTKARTIVDTAQAKADRLTQGADKYCTEVMESLDQQLDKLKQDVHAGLNVLYTRQQRAAQEYAAAQQQNNTQPSEQEEQR